MKERKTPLGCDSSFFLIVSQKERGGREGVMCVRTRETKRVKNLEIGVVRERKRKTLMSARSVVRGRGDFDAS